MSIYRLNISIEMENPDDEDALQDALYLIEKHKSMGSVDINKRTKVSLTRDGDRAGLNLLLPKLQGSRGGEHLQGRKASIQEAIKYLKKSEE